MEYSRYIYTFLYFLYQIVADFGWAACTKRQGNRLFLEDLRLKTENFPSEP